MKKRIITGLIMAVTLIPVLFFSFTVAYPIVVTLFCVIGSYEMLRCIGCGKSKSIVLPSLLFALVLPLGSYFMETVFKSGQNYLVLCFILCFFYMLYMFTVGVAFRGNRKFGDVATALVVVLYTVIGFTCMAMLRYRTYGEFLIFMVFVGPFVTDIFAYFTGYFFGRHKLIPEISPKKTVEGSVGGTLFGSASFVVFGVIVFVITSNLRDFWPETVFPQYAVLAVNGFLVSVFSQVGDLATSWIKREHGIKDFGNIFPGHGGVIDRFDSVLITAPLLLILSSLEAPFAMFA